MYGFPIKSAPSTPNCANMRLRLRGQQPCATARCRRSRLHWTRCVQNWANRVYPRQMAEGWPDPRRGEPMAINQPVEPLLNRSCEQSYTPPSPTRQVMRDNLYKALNVAGDCVRNLTNQ